MPAVVMVIKQDTCAHVAEGERGISAVRASVLLVLNVS